MTVGGCAPPLHFKSHAEWTHREGQPKIAFHHHNHTASLPQPEGDETNKIASEVTQKFIYVVLWIIHLTESQFIKTHVSQIQELSTLPP
jgi:hypothetical protein